jgi:hypothetical protein
MTALELVAVIGVCIAAMIIVGLAMKGLDWLEENYKQISTWWFIAAGTWLFGRTGAKAFGYEPIVPFAVFALLTIPIVVHQIVWLELREDYEKYETEE